MQFLGLGIDYKAESMDFRTSSIVRTMDEIRKPINSV
jgi:hypothetical protein